MLYVFYEQNETHYCERAELLIKKLLAKRPNAELLRITKEVTHNGSSSFNIDDILATQGLFKRNFILYLAFMDDVFLSFNDIQLDNMKQSKHVCVVALHEPSSRYREKISKFANKTFVCNKGYNRQKYQMSDRHNIFAVVNVFKKGNKKDTWKAFARAKIEGVEGEAIAGILFWAVKNMILKKDFKIFSEKKLKKIAIRIPELVHEARENSQDIHNALEKWILNEL